MDRCWREPAWACFRKTGLAPWVPIKFDARRVQLMESSGCGKIAMVADGHAFISEDSGRQWSACAGAPVGTEWYSRNPSPLSRRRPSSSTPETSAAPTMSDPQWMMNGNAVSGATGTSFNVPTTTSGQDSVSLRISAGGQSQTSDPVTFRIKNYARPTVHLSLAQSTIAAGATDGVSATSTGSECGDPPGAGQRASR
jgi:hypothetical protein